MILNSRVFNSSIIAGEGGQITGLTVIKEYKISWGTVSGATGYRVLRNGEEIYNGPNNYCHDTPPNTTVMLIYSVEALGISSNPGNIITPPINPTKHGLSIIFKNKFNKILHNVRPIITQNDNTFDYIMSSNGIYTYELLDGIYELDAEVPENFNDFIPRTVSLTYTTSLEYIIN
jgi:hypothetical protein